MRYFWIPVLFLTSLANAQIYITSKQDIQQNLSEATRSVDYYVSSATINPAIICWAGAFDDTIFGDTVVTEFTYNTVALTSLQTIVDTFHTLTWYYIPNPERGTHTMTITRAGVSTAVDTFCATLANASQSTTADGTGITQSDVNSPFQVDVVASGGAMTFSVGYTDTNVFSGQGTNMRTFFRVSNDFWWSAYIEPVGAGTVSHIYTGGAADTMHLIAVSIGEAASQADKVFPKPTSSILTNGTFNRGTFTK